jgi:hypothetical protein
LRYVTQYFVACDGFGDNALLGSAMRTLYKLCCSGSTARSVYNRSAIHTYTMTGGPSHGGIR